MLHGSRDVLFDGSRTMDVLGWIAAIALLLVATLILVGPSPTAPLPTDWVGVPSDLPGTLPVPK
jgi:hypothetical protein